MFSLRWTGVSVDQETKVVSIPNRSARRAVLSGRGKIPTGTGDNPAAAHQALTVVDMHNWTRVNALSPAFVGNTRLRGAGACDELETMKLWEDGNIVLHKSL